MPKHPAGPARSTRSPREASTKKEIQSYRRADHADTKGSRGEETENGESDREGEGARGSAEGDGGRVEGDEGAEVAEASGLLDGAREKVGMGMVEQALPLAERALRILKSLEGVSKGKAVTLPALNLLAEIHVEMGDVDAARTLFLQAVTIDSDGAIPPEQGGGAEKFLWLAQLSEQGGEESVQYFQKGAAILRTRLSQLRHTLEEAAASDGMVVDKEEDDDDDDQTSQLLSAISETTQKLTSALCSTIEIHMTDLSFSPHAEQHCESLIAETLLLSPSSPEPLQTLASIRISQARIPEARKALLQSLELWKGKDLEEAEDVDDEEESHVVPDFPTRISLARLCVEVEMYEQALEVVERLVGEDDQSVEAWYLGGWCLYLIGSNDEARRGSANTKATTERRSANAEETRAALISSREWLSRCLTLCDMLEYEDERLREHARELVAGLEGEIGGDGADGEDGELVGEGDEMVDVENGEG